MDTIPDTLGYPGPNSTHIQHKNYSNYLLNLTKNEQKSINLILIDGRFRVACCLKCFNVINPKCLIAFDDFLNRPYYHVVLDYYDIVEKTIDKSMVILKKKNSIKTIPENLILEYELIPN
jgi:hypothetical protein